MRGGFRIASSLAGGLLAWCLIAAVARSAEPGPRSAAEMAARIDQLLAARLQTEGVSAAASADDAEFLRRATLDLTGTIPSVGDVRAILAKGGPENRAQVVSRLLSRPSHATHLATTWRKVLLPSNPSLQFSPLSLQNWLRTKFAENAPYDAMAREILTATGNVNQSGPALYYTALELKPEELAASVSRVFLGVQISCAQCHDHPFDHWKRHDFWGMAAFFARVQPANPQLRFQVQDLAEGEVKLPGTEAVVRPTFLAGGPAEDLEGTTRRQQLAEWMTAPENPYFAKAAVNRVWAHLFGRGLVEPVDDLGAHNPPSHPELLDELARQFRETKYDLRGLLETLVRTDAYQRSSRWDSAVSPRPELLAAMPVKSLTAEQIYDAIEEATRRRRPVAAAGFGQQNRFFDQNRQAFLNKFQAPAQAATEFQAGIPQALTMLNGGLVADATDPEKGDLLGALEAPFFSDAERVEALFLSVLGRPPRDDERRSFAAHVAAAGSDDARRKALSDVLWALLNSAEFVLNH